MGKSDLVEWIGRRHAPGSKARRLINPDTSGHEDDERGLEDPAPSLSPLKGERDKNASKTRVCGRYTV